MTMRKALLSSVFICGCFASSVVMAGFQFTAPVEQYQPMQQAPVSGGLLPAPNQPMPSVSNPPVAQQPILTSPQITSSMPENITPAAQQEIIWSADRPVLSATTAQPNDSEIAVGFGNNLPLVTALRQIIPPQYTYVLDQNIPTGTKVSWNGGQAWPNVLSATLDDANLTSSVIGKIVTIKPKSIEDSIAKMALLPAPSVTTETPPTVQSSRPIATAQPVQTMAPALPNPTQQRPMITNAAAQNLPVVKETVAEETILRQPTEGQWMARSGDSLQTILEGWSALENVDLFWSSDFDYPLIGDVNISGNFEKAVETLLQGFSTASPQPVGRLHPNLPHGPAVLIVETKQNQS